MAGDSYDPKAREASFRSMLQRVAVGLALFVATLAAVVVLPVFPIPVSIALALGLMQLPLLLVGAIYINNLEYSWLPTAVGVGVLFAFFPLWAYSQWENKRIEAREKAIILISDLEGDLEANIKMAEEMEQGLKAYGHVVMRVRIVPDAYLDWCKAHDTSPGGAGRKKYVAAAVAERYGDQT